MEAVSSKEDAGLTEDDSGPLRDLDVRETGFADLRGPIRIRRPIVILINFRLSKCG